MTSPAGPAARYGRPPTAAARRARAVALGLLLLAFTALVVVLALRRASVPVTSVPRSFEVLGPAAVRVEWEVSRDPGTVAECLVRARGADGAEVGRELVRVPAAAGRRTVVTHDLSTAAPAVTGEVRSCIAVEP